MRNNRAERSKTINVFNNDDDSSRLAVSSWQDFFNGLVCFKEVGTRIGERNVFVRTENVVSKSRIARNMARLKISATDGKRIDRG